MGEEILTPVPTKGFIMGDAIYQKTKFLVQIVLPALSTLYFTLGAVWGLPGVEQVIGTLAALATFFGVMLGLSNKTYNASEAKYVGVINVQENDVGKTVYSLDLNGAPEELLQKKEVIFKIGSSPTLP
jgi:hypothetical protein